MKAEDEALVRKAVRLSWASDRDADGVGPMLAFDRILARLSAAERVVEAEKRLYAENDREYAYGEPIPSDEWIAADAEVRAALAAYDASTK